jgi:hypothetical protein
MIVAALFVPRRRRIVDSSNTVVREFVRTAVDKQVFVQSFTPFNHALITSL